MEFNQGNLERNIRFLEESKKYNQRKMKNIQNIISFILAANICLFIIAMLLSFHLKGISTGSWFIIGAFLAVYLSTVSYMICRYKEYERNTLDYIKEVSKSLEELKVTLKDDKTRENH